jgi:hypothetical protein
VQKCSGRLLLPNHEIGSVGFIRPVPCLFLVVNPVCDAALTIRVIREARRRSMNLVITFICSIEVIKDVRRQG